MNTFVQAWASHVATLVAADIATAMVACATKLKDDAVIVAASLHSLIDTQSLTHTREHLWVSV